MNGDTNDHNCPDGSYKCNECEFVSDSQGGLGVHRVKKHKVNGCDNINSVSVVCEYPQGKFFYCRLCDNIIKSWPNFKRHYKNIHPNIPLTVSAICTLCNRVFSELKGVGVHMTFLPRHLFLLRLRPQSCLQLIFLKVNHLMIRVYRS